MPAKNNNLCQIKKCREPTAIIYYNKGVCQKHWEKHCNTGKYNLKEELNIKN